MSQDSLYEETAKTYCSALDRLARAYEAEPDARRDLIQEIHLQLWRSFVSFDQRCSLRTWVYRVAHNVATGHVIRQSRIRNRLVSLEDLEAVEIAPGGDRESEASKNQMLERLSTLIQRLKPLDRQIILSYLEGMSASATSEITGLAILFVWPNLMPSIRTPRLLLNWAPLFALAAIWLAIFIPSRRRQHQRLEKEIEQLRTLEREYRV